MGCAACGQKTSRTSKRASTRQNRRNDFFYNNRMAYQWAVPTWQFFHSFAAKINEDFYKTHQLECLNIIKNICRVLPCPYCQTHAMNFFKHVDFKNYPTKESFRQLLLVYHNDVNRVTKKPKITRNDLNKYDNSVFINITKNFLNTIKSYRGTMGGGYADTQARDSMRNYITQWVNQYHIYFL